MTTIAEDADMLRTLKALAEETKKAYERDKAAADEAERRFFDRMEAEGVGSIKVGNTNFVPIGTVYGQVQDREAFIDWAQENAPELLEMKERKAIVNELVRERVESGQELPRGLGFYVKEYVSQRAG